MTRKKNTSKFKIKVVLEAIKEHSTVTGLAQKYDLAPQQINLWKRGANADSVFEGKGKSKKSQADEEKDHLLKTIGQLKVENDRTVGLFLNDALR